MLKNIEKLKEIDLSEQPIESVAEKIRKIFAPALGIYIHTTPYNKTAYPKIIERAVQNPDLVTVFDEVERISYTLPKWNKVYKRASTPDNSMFYGSPTIEEDNKNFLDYCRITISCEACDLLRQPEFSLDDNVRHMTFGQWEVIDTLMLLTIIDPTKNYKMPIMKKVKDEFLWKLNYHPEQKDATLAYMTYLAQEFSKPVAEGANHEYLISALFSERMIIGSGFDGIIYPSVKAEGVGLCVAIHPNSVKKIRLRQVSQYKVKREIGNTRITLQKRCDVEDGATTFKLLDIAEYDRLKRL